MWTLLLACGFGAEPTKELLVEPKDAVAGKLPGGAVILDVRSPAKYETGHLPGAVQLSLTAWSKAVTDGEATEAFWSKAFAAAKLDPESVFIVSGDDMREVCRGWWLLRHAGVTDVRVFNGKVAAYADAGGKLSQETPVRPQVKLKDWKPRPDLHAQKEDVLKIVGKGAIIDARSKDEFAAGRVPGAKHLEWSEVLNEKGAFKSREAIRKQMIDRGIDPNDSPTCYCASGGRASVLAFAVELVGNKPAKNYYRSWSEWGQDSKTPKEK